jgi:hypothetical protein
MVKGKKLTKPGHTRESLAKRLSAARRSLKLSLGAVCKAMNNEIHPSSLLAYEQGSRSMRGEVLLNLLMLYGLSLQGESPPEAMEVDLSVLKAEPEFVSFCRRLLEMEVVARKGTLKSLNRLFRYGSAR